MPSPSRRAALASAVSIALAGGFRGALRAAEPLATGATDEHLAPFDKLFTEFVADHKLPGAGVAVARHGKLVYARGFGFADVEHARPARPDSPFRIASVSKPITAVGVLVLADRGKLKLDDPVVKHVALKPVLPAGGRFDERWERITVRQCLRHTGGWDRDKKGGFDPVGVPGRIGRALDLDGPPDPDDVVRYMMGHPLDFDPGERMAYSNLGYLVLGRVIEGATGEKYEPWVKKNVLAPLKLTDVALARAVPEKRPKAEVRYYDGRGRTGPCLYPPRAGLPVPVPDGAENVEAFEAHGGWIASPVDLVRFACALDAPRSPLLSSELLKEMVARPEGAAGFTADKKPRRAYYGCGWDVCPDGTSGRATTWHTGLIAGTSALLVRRFDGLTWAVLFNTDAGAKGKAACDLIDAPMHAAADAVKKWPEGE